MAELWRLIGWRRVAVTGACLIVWRLLLFVPVWQANGRLLELRLNQQIHPGAMASLANDLPLEPYSIGLLGLGPYINAVIVVLLIRVISRYVRDMAGTPGGRDAIHRWTRVLTALFAGAQAYGWTVLMQSANVLPSNLAGGPRLVLMIELAAGTIAILFLADVIDDFGAGYGYGAILLYALQPVGLEVHRLAGRIAANPSIEALYLPLGLWIGFSVLIAAMSVAAVLGIRRITPPEAGHGTAARTVSISFLVAGVLRPPAYAGALMALPFIVAQNYMASNPIGARSVEAAWTPLGANVWMDALYVAVNCTLIIGGVYFVAATDWATAPAFVRRRVYTLALIAGGFLALTVAILPVLEEAASRAAGTELPLSGFDAILVTAVIAGVFAFVLQRPVRPTQSPNLVPQVP